MRELLGSWLLLIHKSRSIHWNVLVILLWMGGSSQVGTFVVSKTYCYFWLETFVGDMAYCHKRASALGLGNKKGHVQMHLDFDVGGRTDVDHC